MGSCRRTRTLYSFLVGNIVAACFEPELRKIIIEARIRPLPNLHVIKTILTAIGINAWVFGDRNTLKDLPGVLGKQLDKLQLAQRYIHMSILVK